MESAIVKLIFGELSCHFYTALYSSWHRVHQIFQKPSIVVPEGLPHFMAMTNKVLSGAGILRGHFSHHEPPQILNYVEIRTLRWPV